MTEHAAPAVQVRPLTPERAGDSEAATDLYHGPLPLFIDAGFGIIQEEPAMTVVRKTLTPP